MLQGSMAAFDSTLNLRMIGFLLDRAYSEIWRTVIGSQVKIPV